MEPYNITLSATLNRAVPREQVFGFGRLIAEGHLLSVAAHETSFTLTMTSDIASPVRALAEAYEAFVEKLALSGYMVTAWDAVEALSADEVERRISAASLPPMISAKEFAQLCGFASHQRIYELETERRKAASEGTTHPFPTPVVPGWWIKTAAERYAATRKRKPGPAPKGQSSQG